MQRPIKIQARQTLSTDQEGTHEVPPLAMELPAIDGSWVWKVSFFQGCSSCAQIAYPAHRRSTKQTQWGL